MAVIICRFCGKSFEGTHNQRYCSQECRTQGTKNNRKAWEKATGFKEKQKLRMRKNRAAQSEAKRIEREEAERRRAAERAAKDEAHAIDQQKKLEEEAASGSTFALQKLALQKGDILAYWRLYKACVIQSDIKSGKYPNWGHHYVGDVDVYNPDFEMLVMFSINSERKRLE